jgi:hypothetical protein
MAITGTAAMGAEDLFLKLREALETTGIPHMVTGSFVTAVHGVPRATHDIDVVIAPTGSQLPALVRQFSESDDYAELEDAIQALRHRSQFNVIDERGVWKIDFIIRKDRPFSMAEFARRRITNILGIPVYAATAEDLLIAKLEWAKLGESERQLRGRRDRADPVLPRGGGKGISISSRGSSGKWASRTLRFAHFGSSVSRLSR